MASILHRIVLALKPALLGDCGQTGTFAGLAGEIVFRSSRSKGLERRSHVFDWHGAHRGHVDTERMQIFKGLTA
jgi:hypothetical protein